MALLRNTGFESDAAWTLVDGAAYVTSPVHSGSRALSIRFVQGTLLPPRRSKYGAARQAITTKTGTRIDLSAWAKPVPGGLSLVALRVENPTGAEPEVVDSLLLNGGDWKLLSGSIVAAGGSVTVEVIAQAGAWFVDDVKAVKPAASWSTPADLRTVPPPVDPQLKAFRAECFRWEQEAERLGNVVTVDGQHPEQAQYETFGEAWRAIRGRCSPSNPYIIQVAEGFQWPKNAMIRGIMADQTIWVQNHSGGLVIRGSGPKTVFWIPRDYVYYINPLPASALRLNSGRVFIRDCTLGFGNAETGELDTPWSRPREEDLPLVEHLKPAYSLCSEREDTYETEWRDYGCRQVSQNCISVSVTIPGMQLGLFAYNCRIYAMYDLCIHGGFRNGAATTPDEPPSLIITESCRLILNNNDVGAHYIRSNDDGYAFVSGHTLGWVKDCVAEGDTHNRFLHHRSPMQASTSRDEPVKIWFENLQYVVRTIDANVGNSTLWMFPGAMRVGDVFVFNRCTFRWTSELLAYWRNHPDDVPTGDTYTMVRDGVQLVGGGFGITVAGPSYSPTQTDGTNVSIYFRNCVFDVDFSHFDWYVKRQTIPANPKWTLLSVTTEMLHSRADDRDWWVDFYLQDCKIRLRGSPEDKAHYIKFFTSYPDRVTVYEE